MPPFGLSPVLVISFTLAIWLLDGTAGHSARPRRALSQACGSAAVVGWCFGFGYHLAGLWWLGAAFLVEPDKFAWLLPLGVIGLPAALGLYSAVGFALARLFWSVSPARVLWFAAALTAAEWARGTLFTGFPWNAYGMALGEHLPTAQVASLVGLYGLTLLTVLIGALPAAGVDLADRQPRLRGWPFASSLVLAASVLCFGALRLQAPASPLLPGVKLRVMQPNVPQDVGYDPQSAADLVKSYLDLSDRATSPTTSGLADVTHLVWPESPFPFALTGESRALGAIAKALSGRTVLLTGGVRLENNARPNGDAFNSLFVLGRNGQIVDSYDKVHLVPFGEYLPGGNLLRWIGLRQFVELPGGFIPGPSRHAVSVPGLPPVQPLICYEAIFSGQVTPERVGAPRPGVLVNITNDAWFGLTPGPYQHWQQARLRAVEEGIPLIRSANTGISAVTDGFGRVLAEVPLGVAGVLDAGVPRALPPTTFALYPKIAPFVLWAALGLAGLVLGRTRRQSAV